MVLGFSFGYGIGGDFSVGYVTKFRSHFCDTCSSMLSSLLTLIFRELESTLSWVWSWLQVIGMSSGLSQAIPAVNCNAPQHGPWSFRFKASLRHVSGVQRPGQWFGIRLSQSQSSCRRRALTGNGVLRVKSFIGVRPRLCVSDFLYSSFTKKHNIEQGRGLYIQGVLV